MTGDIKTKLFVWTYVQMMVFFNAANLWQTKNL